MSRHDIVITIISLWVNRQSRVETSYAANGGLTDTPCLGPPSASSEPIASRSVLAFRLYQNLASAFPSSFKPPLMADPGTSVQTLPQGGGLQIEHEEVAAQEHPLDPTTFVAPATLPVPSVIIEFCDRVSSLCGHSAARRILIPRLITTVPMVGFNLFPCPYWKSRLKHYPTLILGYTERVGFQRSSS